MPSPDSIPADRTTSRAASRDDARARSFPLSARAIAVLAIALWCIVEWTVLRQPRIAADWVGWRESDTQAIARHLTEPGSSFLYPRIDWGGDGPGYVETELMLYPAIVALFLRVFGNVEWPGQLVSLLCIAGAAWVLFQTLTRLYGERPALFGLGTFLVAPVLAFVGSSVQPEALCLLLFVIAWHYFLKYETESRPSQLIPFALVGGIAMLVKPTAAQLGIASFVVLAIRGRDKLKKPEVWAAWALMIVMLATFMWHAHNLFVQYGNTFGVLSGGDSKVPKLRHLLIPGVYRQAATTVLAWGFGILGTLAFVAALLRARVDAAIWGLFVASLAWTFIALRYVCNASWGGVHYTIVCAVLAAHCVASMVPHAADSLRSKRWTYAVGALAAVGALVFTIGMRRKGMTPTHEAEQVIAAGHELAALSKPEDLVIVRSSRFVFDPFWSTPSNYQDPRVFYTANRHGWVLGRDETDPAILGNLAKKGARFYIEPGEGYVDEQPPLDAWLGAHAKLVGTTAIGGRIFAL